MELKVFKNFELLVEASGKQESMSSKCDVMIEQQEYQKIVSQFQDDTESEYQSAINKKRGLDIKSIPKWFWFVLLFFAYDNLLIWFSTPLIFYPMLLVGIIIAIIFATGNGYIISAFIRMVKLIFQVGKNNLTKKQV